MSALATCYIVWFPTPATDRASTRPERPSPVFGRKRVLMRRVFSVLLCLTAGLILLSGVGLSESKSLRPLPLGTTGLPQTVTAKSTDQADLQRAGYILDDRNADLQLKDRRERSYSFQGSLGSSALLVDNEYHDPDESDNDSDIELRANRHMHSDT